MKTVVTFTIDHADVSQAQLKQIDLYVTESSLQSEAAWGYTVLNEAACRGTAKVTIEVEN